MSRVVMDTCERISLLSKTCQGETLVEKDRNESERTALTRATLIRPPVPEVSENFQGNLDAVTFILRDLPHAFPHNLLVASVRDSHNVNTFRYLETEKFIWKR